MKVKIEFTIDVTREQRAALAQEMTSHSQTGRLATRGDVRFMIAGMGMYEFNKLMTETYGVSTEFPHRVSRK